MGFFDGIKKKKTKKEKEEADFFDFDEVKKNRILWQKKEQDEKVFNHFISDHSFKNNVNNINGTSINSKQVVIKMIGNRKADGVLPTMKYMSDGSAEIYGFDELGEERTYEQVYRSWLKDFTGKKNANEVMHLVFSIDEECTEKNLKILQESVADVMHTCLREYKYFMMIHRDQAKPHCHIALNKNNKFDKRKLHFDKGEIKEFFNEMRNQFAMQLSIRGLNYHNKNVLEKDLTKELKKLKENDYKNDINLSVEIAKTMENFKHMEGVYERENEKLKNEINDLENSKKSIGQKLNQVGKKSKNYKEKFKIMSEIKKINKEIGKRWREVKKNSIELKKCVENFKKFEWERNKFSADVSSLEQKKKFRDLLKNEILNYKVSGKLSKNEFRLLSELENNILLSEKKVSDNVLENVKSSIIVSKLLGKKNNAFELIKCYQELEKNINKLAVCKYASDENKKEFRDKLVSNQKLIYNLIENRYNSLNKKFVDEKFEVKPFYLNEYEKLSVFLGKANDKNLEILKQRCEAYKAKSKSNKTSQTKTQTEQKSTAQTPTNSQPNSQNLFTQAEQKSTQNSQSEDTKTKTSEPPKRTPNLDDTSKLDEHLKHAFILWLIKKRNITNTKFYEGFFKEQINSNTMQDFKELFKEFQKSQTQSMGGR